MAFNLTFDNITSRNIKHIYSGQTMKITPQVSSDYPKLTKLKRANEEENQKREVMRTNIYEPEHGCLVPKAPAFRIVSRAEADEIVQRVSRPTKAATWKSEGTDGNTQIETEKGGNKEVTGKGEVEQTIKEEDQE